MTLKINFHAAGFLFVAFYFAFPSNVQATAILYGIDNTNAALRTLVRIDQSSAALTTVGAIQPGISGASGMVYDPATQTVYATGGVFTAEPRFFNTNLLTLNLSTGAGTVVGPTMHETNLSVNGNITDLARRPTDGAIFAFAPTGIPSAGTSDILDVLMTLDSTTGLATLVGQTGFGPPPAAQDSAGNGIAFDLSGNLLQANQHSLNTIDPATGATTLGIALDFTGTLFDASLEFVRVAAMTVHPETGDIYTSVMISGRTTGRSFLAILDPSFGTFDYVGEFAGAKIDALAFVVPEPTTLLLLGLGLAGLGFTRQRLH